MPDPQTPLSADATTHAPQGNSDVMALLEQSWEKSLNDPVAMILPTLGGAAGTLLAMVLVFAAAQVWKQFKAWFWRSVGRLGSRRGFSWLALQAYLRSLEASYGILVNIYLRHEETLSLKEVFVPLTLREATLNSQSSGQRSSQQILTDPQQKRLVLLGAPGSGKSTLLKALAAGISRREWPQFRDTVPVLAPLRVYGQVANNTKLLDWLVDSLLPQLGLNKSTALLESLLQQGRLLLLLDGLDEVAGEHLGSVNQQIAVFLDSHDSGQRCRVLLTCREQNYDDLPDRGFFSRDGFVEYRVAELRDSEIRAFVQRRAGHFTEKGKSLDHYLEQVFAHADITQLHRSPLLLTLSMGIYLCQPGAAVPQNLARFYEQAIDNLLWRHNFREVRRLRQNPAEPLRSAEDFGSANRHTVDDKFALLKHFALQTLVEAGEQGRDFEEFSFAAVKACAQRLAEQGILEHALDPAALVREIRDQAGLLNALQDGLWVFAHRSFHEYCAARALMERSRDDEGYRRVAAQWHNTAWRQVLLFYAAMPEDNAVRLVQALQQHAQQDPSLLPLAGHCAAVLAQPQIPLRLEIMRQLGEALLAADTGTRPILLKSLLALGNSRDQSLREQLDAILRALVDTSDPAQVAHQAGRMEPGLALQFLGYLAASPLPIRRQAALAGLEQLDGVEKIPYLWRLLRDALAEDDKRLAGQAGLQLGVMMADPQALEMLDTCVPFQVERAISTRIAEVYPFLPDGAPPSALALLLACLAHCQDCLESMESSPPIDFFWRQFASYCLTPKSPAELREWRRLPKDAKRWLPKIAPLYLGILLCRLPWLGAVLWVFGIWQMHVSVVVQIIDWVWLGIISALSFILVGFVLAWYWWPWRTLLDKFNLLGSLEAYPLFLRRHLTPYLNVEQLSGLKRFWRKTGHRLKQIMGLGSAVLLSVLAALLHTPSFDVGHLKAITGLAIDSSGTKLLSASMDGSAQLWDAQSGAKLRRFKHNRYPTAVAFSLDGKTLLTGSYDGTALLWDAQAGTELRRFKHDDLVNAVAFAPDGKTLLTGSYDRTARLWDAQAGTELRRFKHDDDVNNVAFAPDGRTLLTGSNDNTARLWDAQAGTELRRFKHDGHVSAVAFAPDGKTLLTGSWGSARLWDVKIGTELRRFEHYGYVSAVAFAPDGKTLSTGSYDGTARLWDAQAGTELRRFKHADDVNAVVFAPDGKTLYTAGGEAIIRAWDTTSGVLLWQSPSPRPYWLPDTWKSWNIAYLWLGLCFASLFLPALKIFDRHHVWYLRKPNRYLHLYQIPGVERWLPPTTTIPGQASPPRSTGTG